MINILVFYFCFQEKINKNVKNNNNIKKKMVGFNYKRMTYAGILALNTKVAVCSPSANWFYLFLIFSNKTRVSLYALSSSLSQLRRLLLLLLECVVPYPSLYSPATLTLFVIQQGELQVHKNVVISLHGKKEVVARARLTTEFDG